MTRLLLAHPDVPVDDWNAFFADAIRSKAMRAIAPTTTGVKVLLRRGTRLPLDGALVSSWCASQVEAESFGPRVRTQAIDLGSVIAVAVHDDGLIEYVCVGQEEKPTGSR